MDQFNKALSFILGLVVVAVFIVVASGKFNFKNISLFKGKTPTASVSPTPSASPTKTPAQSTQTSTSVVVQTKSGTFVTVTPTYNPSFHAYNGTTAPTSIPKTGVPIVFFPLLGAAFFSGISLNAFSKKKK